MHHSNSVFLASLRAYQRLPYRTSNQWAAVRACTDCQRNMRMILGSGRRRNPLEGHSHLTIAANTKQLPKICRLLRSFQAARLRCGFRIWGITTSTVAHGGALRSYRQAQAFDRIQQMLHVVVHLHAFECLNHRLRLLLYFYIRTGSTHCSESENPLKSSSPHACTIWLKLSDHTRILHKDGMQEY